MNKTFTNTDFKSTRFRSITVTAIMVALSTILLQLHFPLPLFPQFIKFDLSDVPVLIVSFACGPLYGIIAELIKNLIHLPFTTTSGVGELMDFTVSAIFVGVAGFLYRSNKTRRRAILSLLISVFLSTIIAFFINFYIVIPFYIKIFGINIDILLKSTKLFSSHMHNLFDFSLWVCTPFNILKFGAVSIMTILIYKPISKIIHRK